MSSPSHNHDPSTSINSIESGSSRYTYSPPATLPATPNGTHPRPIPSAAVSIAHSYAHRISQSTVRPNLGTIYAYSCRVPSLSDPLRVVTPRPETDYDSFRTPPSDGRADPLGMTREVESNPDVLDALHEKNEHFRDRLFNAAERKRDICVEGAHWVMKRLRTQPRIYNENGAKRTDIGLWPDGREEEMGAFIAEGCVRSWGKKEMWFTMVMLVLVMSLLHLFEAEKSTILDLALATKAFRDLDNWKKGLPVGLMRVMGIGGILGLTKLANSHSRPLVFFLGGILCLAGAALAASRPDFTDHVYPTGAVIYALGFSGVKVAAAIIVTDITAPLWRVLCLFALQFTVPIWEITAPWIEDYLKDETKVPNWRNPIWIFSGIFLALAGPLILALFVFNRRAANLGYTPHTHRPYGWSACDFKSYRTTLLLFTARYDCVGASLFTLSAVAAALLLAFEPPGGWTSQGYYYWGLGAITVVTMVAFIYWEQHVNPEEMFQFLMRPPASAVVFPEPPEAVIEVRNDSASAIDRVEFTAAIIAAKKREEKMGVFHNNCRGVISPTLFATHRALGFFSVTFCSAFVLAVGTGLGNSMPLTTKLNEIENGFDVIPFIAIFIGFFSALTTAIVIPYYRRVRFPVLFGLILLCFSTMLPFFLNVRVPLTPADVHGSYYLSMYDQVFLRAGYGMLELPLLVGAQRACITHSDETIMTGLMLFVRELGNLAGIAMSDWSAKKTSQSAAAKLRLADEYQALKRDNLLRKDKDPEHDVRSVAAVLAVVAMVLAVASMRDMDVSKSVGSGVMVIGGKKSPQELWVEACAQHRLNEEREWAEEEARYHGENRGSWPRSDDGIVV